MTLRDVAVAVWQDDAYFDRYDRLLPRLRGDGPVKNQAMADQTRTR
ncbi:MAG: hypothetical protein LCI02_26150 [Proteobacteria bacterium]|nr:hypothetical protein [Pseudomonadota bacterium]